MLSDLIREAEEVLGIKVSDEDTRTFVVSKINIAAKELYDSFELPGSLWEQNFSITSDDEHITLPWYVGGIRAVRYSATMDKVTVVDSRPRYHVGEWTQGVLEWRVVGETPLIRDITDQASLTFTIDEAEDEEFSVTITGETTTSRRTSETLVFADGETSKTTTKQWKLGPVGIQSIRKSRVTTQNVSVTETATAVQIAEIPNCQLEAINTLIQVHDQQTNPLSIYGTEYEILFKWRYIQMYFDTDEFQCRDFDDAIIWKLREHFYSKKDGMTDEAVAASKKCETLISRIINQKEASVEKKVNFGTRRFAFLQRYTSFLEKYGNPLNTRF